LVKPDLCRSFAGRKEALRGQPQPKELNHGFPGFHGLRILHQRPHLKTIYTEANEGNEEEFSLRYLRFLLFKTNPCHPYHNSDESCNSNKSFTLRVV